MGHHVLTFSYLVTNSKTSKIVKARNLNYKKGNCNDLSIFIDSYHDYWVNLFRGNTIDECLLIFMNIYFLGIQKNIKPYKIICSSNVCPWQSIELKKLIQTKKDLWHNLIKRRAHNYESRDDALIYYKNVRKKCREKLNLILKSMNQI